MKLPFDTRERTGPGFDVDDPDERRALVALSLVPGIGQSRIRTILARLGRPSAVWGASRTTLTGLPSIGDRTAEMILTFDPEAAANEQFDRAEELNATFVTRWDGAFPERLRHIYDPPLFLWVRGTLDEHGVPSVAIVGTRRCTDYGRRIAYDLGADLARSGFTVVSGLAYGIDAAAHRGALDAGGRTIAVLGSGVGWIYPQSHGELARRAMEQGAVASEYPIDVEPETGYFPERNRIVSGLTLGTVVVESHVKGGALITARMAVEQNREVFAVPGDAGRSAAVGTNNLIQRGHAKLVTCADDVIEEFHLAGLSPASSDDASSPDRPDPAASLDGPARALYDALDTTPVHLDDLCTAAGVSPSDALVALLELEFEGLVHQLAGKQFRRT